MPRNRLDLRAMITGPWQPRHQQDPAMSLAEPLMLDEPVVPASEVTADTTVSAVVEMPTPSKPDTVIIDDESSTAVLPPRIASRPLLPIAALQPITNSDRYFHIPPKASDWPQRNYSEPPPPALRIHRPFLSARARPDHWWRNFAIFYLIAVLLGYLFLCWAAAIHFHRAFSFLLHFSAVLIGMAWLKG